MRFFLFTLALLAGISLRGEAWTVDLSRPGYWSVWPAGKLRVAVSDEKDGDKSTLHFEQLAHAGFFSLPLKKKEGEGLKEFRFRAKASPASREKKLEVMIQEKDGELFCRQIELTEEWKEYRFPLESLKHYIYGGAKIVDGKLDPAEVTLFRLNGWPAGREFFISGLEFTFAASGGAPAAEKKDVTDNFTVKPIPWGEKTEDFHSYYPGMQDVTIEKSAFLRDGKRSFLLGGWQLDVDGPPWLMRMFGVDVMVYNADEIYTLYAPRRSPDGSHEVSWSDNLWYEAILRRFLGSGIRFWHEHKAHPQYSVLRKLPEFKEVYKAGHFVPYDPFHPQGEAMYLEMFKTWTQYTRKYPIFCYELFNEMIYENPHVISRRAFREEMKAKYGSVAAADKAWGTSFGSFDAVNPPGFTADDGRNESLPRETLTARERKQYPNLAVDWDKFTEDRIYRAVAKLMPKMRSLDPDPKVFSTLQSHLNLWLDYTKIGIKPEMLVDFSDFYSHEAGFNYIESDGYRNADYLAQVLKSFFFSDAVRGFCPAKPIFNAEGPLGLSVRGAHKDDLAAGDLAGLHSAWKFFDATRAEPEGWTGKNFNDSSWGNVKVPAMWGNEGHPMCQVGIYRKTFRLDKPAFGRIYFNGQGFADSAEIYLNGRKVGIVEGFDKRFSFDITDLLEGDNRIAVKIVNRYFLDGMYYGGIRGFASVNTAALEPGKKFHLEERHVRSYFYSQIIRGTFGSMLSYESNLMQPHSKYLPGVKAEVENLMGILADPAARPRSDIAFVYPLETLRAVNHRDYLETILSPATSDLMPFYGAALFARTRGVDVVRNKDLLTGELDYKLIVMPANIRVPAELIPRLSQYVERGGMLFLDFGSLAVNDDTHAALDCSALAGVKVKKLLTAPGSRFADGFSRAELVLNQAIPVMRHADNAPLLTVRELGKGKVFYLNGSFPKEAVRQITGEVIRLSGVDSDLKLSAFGKETCPDAVESRIFTAKDGRTVLYLQNLDPDGAATASLAMAPGNYLVRNAKSGKPIPSVAGKELWSAADLAAGWPVRLRQYDPVVLLIEPDSVKPLALNGISPVRIAMLEELWREYPAKAGQPTVVIAPNSGSTMPGAFGIMPTARKLLTDNGFNVRNYKKGDSLEDAAVLVWPHQRFAMDDPEKVARFVRDGGSLLLCGNAMLNFHVDNRNRKLYDMLGIAEAGNRAGIVYANPVPPPPGDNLRVECRDFTAHPATSYVKSFVTAGCGFLSKMPANAEVLLTAPADSTASGKPVMVAFQYGKGRVIWLGDYWFLRPLNFELGDNAQLWLGMVDYLAGKTGKKLTAAELDKSLFITAAKLEQAERDEKTGNTVIAVPEQKPTYLREFSPSEISGIASGDPIVDLMKL